jgi:hypothetical protein
MPSLILIICLNVVKIIILNNVVTVLLLLSRSYYQEKFTQKIIIFQKQHVYIYQSVNNQNLLS